jgi:hypothetical protein
LITAWISEWQSPHETVSYEGRRGESPANDRFWDKTKRASYRTWIRRATGETAPLSTQPRVEPPSIFVMRAAFRAIAVRE